MSFTIDENCISLGKESEADNNDHSSCPTKFFC